MSESETTTPRPSGFRNFVKNGLVQILATMSAIYWLMAIFVPGRTLIEVVTMGLVGMLAVGAWRWSWVALADLSEGNTGGRAQLAVGIVSLCLSTIGVLVWSLVWRYSGYPQWMIEHPFLGFMRLWSVVGAGLMITAPGAITGAIPPSNWRWIMLAIAIGAGLFGYSLGTSQQGTRSELSIISYHDNRPGCPPEEPIIVSASGIYHDLASPYRSMVKVPVACYASVADARRAGFRPPTK